MRWPSFAALLSGLLAVGVSAQSSFHTSPACWTEPRVYTDGRGGPDLTIERVEEAPLPSAVRSPNQAYAYRLSEEAVPTESGSRFDLTVYNERPYLLRLQVTARSLDAPRWINEHLLYFRVWWGRASGTDYVLDVERELVLLQQMLRYGAIAFQQFRQCEDPDWATTDGCRCYEGAPDGWMPPGVPPGREDLR